MRTMIKIVLSVCLIGAIAGCAGVATSTSPSRDCIYTDMVDNCPV